MSPSTYGNAKSNGQWYGPWVCSQCPGPDKTGQRNPAASYKCRGCHKSYFLVCEKHITAKQAGEPTPEAASVAKYKKESQRLQAEVQALQKAIKEGKPMQNTTPDDPNLPAQPEKDEDKDIKDRKEALETARKELRSLQDMSEGQRNFFSDFEDKLAAAKQKVEEASKAKFQGQPLETQIKGAKTRMEHTRQALEHRKVADQKAQKLAEESKLKAEATAQAVTDMAARLEVQTQEYADLQRANSTQLGARANEAAGPEIMPWVPAALQGLLKAIPKDYATSVCEQHRCSPDQLEAQWPALISHIASLATKKQELVVVSPDTAQASPPTAPGDDKASKDCEQEMDWDDLADFDTFDDFDQEGLDCLVKNGFMAPEQGEDKKDTGKRIAEFIKKRKQEDLQRTEESRKSQAVLKVIKAGKRAKSGTNK